jgi:arylsulfatase A
MRGIFFGEITMAFFLLAGLLGMGWENPPPTNVVFILADDLGWAEVGCFGQRKIPTPHIDRLAREGMRLTRHYSGAPVCAPSRCVLMTGKHLGHAEVRGNLQAKTRFPQFTEGQLPLSEQATTLAMTFRANGYKTGAFGKWGLGPVGSSGDPNKKGFDRFFGYNCQAVAHSYYPEFLWDNDQQVPLNPKPVPGHRKQPEGEVRQEQYLGKTYAPDRILTEALRFLDDNRQNKFFLYLPFIEPHVAMHPPKEWVERFPAEWDSAPYRGERGYLPHPRPRAAYAAMIAHLDDQVGKVMDKLERLGLKGNTLVVFTSDNGATHRSGNGFVGGADPEFFQSTANLRGFKGSVYEGGIRVPTIVRLPSGIQPGSASDQPGYFADWYPTLCEATGIPMGVTPDGQSLWPGLTGKNSKAERKPMVWVFPEYGGQVAVNLGRYKMVRTGLKTKQPGSWELYDLEADPEEKTNLASQKPEILARARAVLNEQTSANPTFPVPVPAE